MASSRFSAVAAKVDRLSRRAWVATTEMVVPFIVGAAADLFVLAGVGAVAYGLGLFAKPLAFIFGGLFLILVGVRGIQAPPPAGGTTE
jgi:hypothetical protein